MTSLVLAILLSQTPPILLKKDGAVLGRVNEINCIGTAVTCSKNGLTADITPTGGGAVGPTGPTGPTGPAGATGPGDLGLSYWTKVSEASLSNEIALGTLASGLILNTTTTGVPTIYAGTTCTNTFVQGVSAAGAASCAGVDLADFTANQGTTTTLLHGNAAGQPTWAGVSLTADAAANQGTTTTVLHGNAAGQPTWGSVNLSTDTAATALPATKGGTGLTTTTAGSVVIGAATNTISQTAAGAAGTILANSSANTPAWLAAGTAGQVLSSRGAAAPVYVAVQTCTTSASTTCTITVARSGCVPLCGMGASAAGSTWVRAAVATTTLTCTFSTSGTNICNCFCP
jgi:hypothetical protein